MPIGSISGLASGVQWADLVDQMINLDVSRRLTPINDQIAAQRKRSDAWNSFQGLVTKLQDAATKLRSGTAFSAFSTTVADSPTLGHKAFTATSSTLAAAGTYGVRVDTLAKSAKLGGGAVADTEAALGLSGTFHVSGAGITVSATDTLLSVRDKINAANTGTAPSGVTATILSTGPSEHRLILTADNTGARGIELVDNEGAAKVLEGLGLVAAAQTQNTKPGEAGVTQSQRFANDTTSLKSLLGLSAPPLVTTIVIDGRSVQVDLSTDTMLTLMNKVAAAGGTANIEQEKVGGQTMSRLSVTGAVSADAGAADPAASQRVVELLGFVKNSAVNEISAGNDALVEVDGFAISRRTNIISDAIAGVTLSLTHADPANTVDLTISRNSESTVKAVEELATAYNSLVEFSDSQRPQGAPLYASGSLRSMMASIRGVLLSDIEGLSATNPYSRAASVGVTLSDKGLLQVDATKLSAALSTNNADVRALFSTAGNPSDAEIRFVDSGSKTLASSYAIDITRAATLASVTGAGFGGAYATGGTDTMTITDAATGTSGSIQLENGDTIGDIVNKLTSMFGAEGLGLTATSVGGQLKITGSTYGSAGSFDVAYTDGGGGPATQLGLAAGSYAGLDVAGTIGGLAATGVGQILTGADGGTTEGLSIRYTGSTVRSAGTLTFSLGLSGMMGQTLEPLARFGDGQIAINMESIERSVDSLDRRADNVSGQLERRREVLSQQFIAMEQAMSKLNAQGSWLTSQINAMQPRSR